ncbi:conserved hypothetical protein [Brachyspira intermedia PWS/A]|uniref:Uncharacterized protein n=1 Tax=Brachyspira intermedia (strain ATCC 51140 / PWS/A) TaxID=1045858 RepID=G0EPF2_BRAIP|nr:hypothetical protein [Brachyspira intermedia]AEM23222.1 conserved hypothetical protein [Brachyspira intermedia PWS/A]
MDDDENLDNTRNTTDEISTSKPVISSVFAAHNIKTEETEKVEEKNEQIEDTTATEESNTETIASSAIVHNNTSSPYSFETFESNREKEEKTEEVEKTEENNYTQDENTEDKASEEIETKEDLIEEKETVVEETKELDVIAEEKTEADTDEVEKIEETVKEETVKVEEKATYSKSDIFKRPVIIPTDDEHIQKSKFNQEEIDTAIKSAPTIDENASVENYKDYSSSSASETKIEELKETINEKIQELKDKEIKIIETEDELKTSSLPEIEKKPAEPYVAPDHSISENKKSNKIVPIVGIIIIILGLSFLGIQFFSGRNNEIDDNFYEEVTNNNTLNTNDLTTNNVISVTNNINTNITKPQTNNAVNTNTTRPQTNNTVNTQTNTTRPQTNNALNTQTNTTRPQTNNAVNTQTNTTRPQTNNTVNTQTNTTRPQTNNAVNTQTNTARPQTNNAVNTQTNTARPQTNNTVNTQTNTATPPTPPKEPEITPPTPPTPPPNPPTANTNAAANNTQANNNTLAYDTDTYKTKWTDTLSSIATAELGDSRRWPSIAVLNENIIKNNPDSIVFNIDIKIPNGGKKKLEDMNDSEKRALYNDYIKVSEMYSKMGKQNLANTIKSQANSILK